MNLHQHIPAYVLSVCQQLHESGHQAYIVGGALRDLALQQTPKDYDIATDAIPDRVEAIFAHTVPTGKKHGTITVVLAPGEIVEVTTYRKDVVYSDGRRPDSVTYSDQLIDDLAKRDFTVNAIAYNPISDQLEDPFHGSADVASRTLQTVGSATERFCEDALRMMRAIRIKAEKGFIMTPELMEAIKTHAHRILNVSQERITEELCRIITSPRPTEGVYDLLNLKLLEQILPELSACANLPQREDYHQYDVFGHIAHALQHTEPDLVVRLSVLLHDIGKAVTSSIDEKGVIHFYGHESVGAEIAASVLERMKFSHDLRQKVVPLIRHHMRNIDSDKALRRMMSALKTPEQARRFAQIRFADKMAGRQQPDVLVTQYRITLERIAQVEAEQIPLQITDLAISGKDITQILGITPGPAVGQLLHTLLQRVLENPDLNNYDTLRTMIPSLYKSQAKHRSAK